MGSNYSKSNAETDAVVQKNDLDKDISTNPDPRSPTPEIARTPLQNKNGSKHNITKNVDLRNTFENGKTEEKLINNNPILSAVIKNHLQSYDPRSPSQEFERTPIVLPSKVEGEADKKAHKADVDIFGTPCLNNDTNYSNLESSCNGYEIKPTLPVPKNLCEGFFDMTLNDTLNENEEPLGCSTASNEGIEKNMSHECATPAQVLETNFDYVQIEPEKFEDSQEDMGDNKDTQILECQIKNVQLYKIIQDDPRSPSIDIDRTPIIVPKVEDASEENVEEMSDDSLMKALQATNSELHEKEVPDGILIYEDKSEPVKTPKKSKSTNNNGSRTPLSCMKNKTDSTHGRSKSTNALCDSKEKETKLQKRISHIPRLKSLTKQPKYFSSESSNSLKSITKTAAVSGDCENTPPHSHRDRWDKDNSIVL